MKNTILDNLSDILRLDYAEFSQTYGQKAREARTRVYGRGLFLTGILALSNYCVNDCLYCGLRSESGVNRFRLDLAQLKTGVDYLESIDVKRILLISGEDAGYNSGDITKIISYAAGKGFYITIGAGIFEDDKMKEFYHAGAREFCLKFESSNRKLFRKIKPSSDFDERIKCLNTASSVGFTIATGGIIGLGGQSLEDVINDIRYTLTFNPSWIPIVPYIPAPGTPMAETTKMGDIELTLKVISIFRLLIEDTKITAGQPAAGSKLGFADPAGNAAALEAGANIFFIDATPAAVQKDFSIVGGRALAGYENILEIIKDNKMTRL
ncbi:MAG: radical SAM protein [Spirochaetales bacterium]|nr:radical SAM protein [Spirochaetales bacterium]